MQNHGHYVIQDHSRLSIMAPWKAHMRLLMCELNNSNLLPLLHRFLVDYVNFTLNRRSLCYQNIIISHIFSTTTFCDLSLTSATVIFKHTKFSEITRNHGRNDVQGHSISVPSGKPVCDFLYV